MPATKTATKAATTATRRRVAAPKVALPELRSASIGRVPTLWAPQTGPVVGMLRFRVGTADESFVTHGITHLVEHLTLSTIERGADRSFNGWVGLNTTTFGATGDRKTVQQFLAQVCDALQDLPVDRLEKELNVLRTEAQQRHSGIVDALLTNRFGATGYGLTWFQEFGFDTVTAESVVAHARRWFTADNAVVMLTGSPRGFSLDLPKGEGPSMPDASVRRTLPALVNAHEDFVGASWTGARGAGGALHLRLLQHRLTENLRHEHGVAYDIGTHQERTGAEVHSAVLCQVIKDNRQIAADAFGDVVRASAADYAFTDQEVADDLRRRATEVKAVGEGVLGWLNMAADSLLFNGDMVQPARVVKDMFAVNAADVNERAKLMADQTLVTVPNNVTVKGLEKRVLANGNSIESPEFSTRSALRLDGKPARISVGGTGVTFFNEKKVASTYLWDDIAGVLSYSSGKRVYLDRDGRILTIHANKWMRENRLREHLDRLAPSERTIRRTDDDVAAVTPMQRVMAPQNWSSEILLVVGSILFLLALGTGLSLADEFTFGNVVATLIEAIGAGTCFGLVIRRRRARTK